MQESGLPAVMETQHLLKEEKIFELSVSVSVGWFFSVFFFFFLAELDFIYTGRLHSTEVEGKFTS